MSYKKLKEYFDLLEQQLISSGKIAKLLEHPTQVGDARETFVADVMRLVLPSGVEIGTGKVIDQFGNESKQIDVVLFDSRFPKFTIGGSSLYPVEGTLATIEVKSTLDKKGYLMALENCSSVLNLMVKCEHAKEANRQIDWYKNKHQLTNAIAKDVFDYQLLPATYIYSYYGDIGNERAMDILKEYYGSDGNLTSFFRKTPRLSCIGKCIAMCNDGRIDVNISGYSRTAKSEYKLLSVFESMHKLRWLLFHISYSISSRIGVRNFRENCEYSIHGYYPVESYIDDGEALLASYFKLDVATKRLQPNQSLKGSA